MTSAPTPPPEVAIWWLPEGGIKQLTGNGPDMADLLPRLGLPAYLRAELYSADGRAGRGRLWVPPDIHLERIAWDDRDPRAPYCAACAGIVCWRRDLAALRGLPGLITDTDLRPLATAEDGDPSPPIAAEYPRSNV